MHLQMTVKDVMEDTMRRQETTSSRRSSKSRGRPQTRLSDKMLMGLMGDMSSSHGGMGSRRRDNSASDLESIGEINCNGSSDEEKDTRPSPMSIRPIGLNDSSRKQNRRRHHQQQQQDQFFNAGMDSSNSSSAPSMRRVVSLVGVSASANKNMESCDTLPTLRKIRSGASITSALLGSSTKDSNTKNQNWTPQRTTTTPITSTRMAELVAMNRGRSSADKLKALKSQSLLSRATGGTTHVLASAAGGTGKLMRRTTSATGSAIALMGNSTLSATKSAANWSADAPVKMMRRTTSGVGSAIALMGDTTMSAANWSADAVNPKKMLKRTSSATVALASRSKSIGSDLFEMQKSLARGPSMMMRRASSFEEPEPESLFVEMATWNPMDPEDRAKYDDHAVKKLLRKSPDAARAKYEHKVGGRGNLTISRYPLATLVGLGASVETLRVAIRAHPLALKPSEEFRSTPLHTACTANTPLEVVKYLYKKYPDAIKETTTYVFLPLHNACQTGVPEPCSLEMIKFLVEAYPEGLMTINKLGDTPLRTAKRNKHMLPEVLEYLEQETDRVFSQEENEHLREVVIERQSWGSNHKDFRNEAAMAMKALSGSVTSTGTEHTETTTECSSCEFTTDNSAHTQYSNECSQHNPLPPLFETGATESCSEFDVSFAN